MIRLESNVASGAAHRPRLVAVIPAYNEERCIGSVVLRTHDFVDSVIVVDDGSSDATARIAEAAGATVVRHKENQGKGVALNTGFQTASEMDPDAVVILDGDGQHRMEEISRVLSPIVDGEADVVVGSRYLGRDCAVPFHRILGHRVFTFLTNVVSGTKVTDSQSGFRAFSPHAVRSIGFSSSGFSVESEMQFLASDHDLRVTEVPITAHYEDGPKRPVVAHGMKVLNGLLQLIGQHRPLFFFGVPGLCTLLGGVAWGIWVVRIYQMKHELAVGYALICVLLLTLGSLSLFSGLILHSMRGLLLGLVQPRIGTDEQSVRK